MVKKANLANVTHEVLRYFDDLGHETKVVIESMSFWYWFYDLLTKKGLDVVISGTV